MDVDATQAPTTPLKGKRPLEDGVLPATPSKTRKGASSPIGTFSADASDAEGDDTPNEEDEGAEARLSAASRGPTPTSLHKELVHELEATPKRPKEDRVRQPDIRAAIQPDRPSTVTQADLDQMLLDVITESKLPFSILGRPKFKKLLRRLAPGRTVLCSRTARGRVPTFYKTMKDKLIAELAKGKWVGTTADAWKNRGKMFTAEDDESGDEESAASTEEAPPEASSMGDILDSGMDVTLLPHRRCTCHLLNLVATVDLGKALERVGTLSIVLTKCKAFWSKQQRSTVAQDDVKADLGKVLPVPNTTRWNSLYNAMREVVWHYEGDRRAAITSVCQKVAMFLASAERHCEDQHSALRHKLALLRANPHAAGQLLFEDATQICANLARFKTEILLAGVSPHKFGQQRNTL
ncbi:hypothetical protein FOCC_FOCC016956 [Frankliniella occidentalis]|nr:hypothetical protein FOCC_FOCC016956 [Frankliniella occidentalis]